MCNFNSVQVQLELWIPIVKPGLEVDIEVLPFRQVIPSGSGRLTTLLASWKPPPLALDA